MHSKSKIFGTDCTAVLFNLIKNSKALFQIVKFLNVSDLAMSKMFEYKSYLFLLLKPKFCLFFTQFSVCAKIISDEKKERK